MINFVSFFPSFFISFETYIHTHTHRAKSDESENPFDHSSLTFVFLLLIRFLIWFDNECHFLSFCFFFAIHLFIQLLQQELQHQQKKRYRKKQTIHMCVWNLKITKSFECFVSVILLNFNGFFPSYENGWRVNESTHTHKHKQLNKLKCKFFFHFVSFLIIT